ncbi:unnamed protein product (macronuclear) [Paramecium tetraurelia]|uniref:Uncharacterized protein n=1 Tax=Paramecium tetraurelia TaxID=5888 RepID=A0EH70_PARTE|nr:uncharacterized protein GSPATT00026985001 [Paramecium tetraurelia]CAK94661.1 unnamed protein product [Paramecium tetraurelia]|eukprot:XP_001462034.1 hypothetical protein (macronuclear) [Paramecium tetraurelia strain d4-2]
MFEELTGFFKEFLDNKFQQMELKIQDIQKQLLQNQREQESMLIVKIEKVFADQDSLQSQFQSLLKEIEVAQKQADEIIEKFSQQVPTTKIKQQQSLPIQQNFQQNLLNLSSIDLKDQSQINSIDYSHRPSNIPIQHTGKLEITNPKVSKFDENQSIVFKTKSGKKYHRAYCGYLSDSKIPITLNEAKNKLTECKICKS